MRFEPFQRRFLAAVDSPRYRTVAASWPRGCGKTTLAGHVVARALTPGDPLYVAGGEVVLFAGSIEQCRLTYRQALTFLEPRLDEYRLVDSATRVAITRKDCRTRLKAVGSNPKTSLGLVGVPLAILDEPAALHTVGGTALWDAVRTAQGKPGSPLKAILTGTLSPADPGSWWPVLVENGTRGSTWVGLLQGRADRWRHWRGDSARQPARPGLPRDGGGAARGTRRGDGGQSAGRSVQVLQVEPAGRRRIHHAVERGGLGAGDGAAGSRARRAGGGRDRSRRRARVVGGDGNLAFRPCRSARGGARHSDPGSAREAPTGNRGERTAGWRSVVRCAWPMVCGCNPPAELWRAVTAAWGKPARVICDRFRLNELVDAIGPGVEIVPRVSRWSESSEDIRALRKMTADGPLAVGKDSRALLTASLGVAMVAVDDAGNVRMKKRGSNNQARDDVAAALVLAAGSFVRSPPVARRRMRSAIVG